MIWNTVYLDPSLQSASCASGPSPAQGNNPFSCPGPSKVLLRCPKIATGGGRRTGGHAGAAQLLALGAAAVVENDGDGGAPALKLGYPVGQR